MTLSIITDRGTLRGKLKYSVEDYNILANKPQINGNVLVGDKSSHELGLADLDDVIYIEANPAGAPSDDLTKLQVGGHIYRIPRVIANPIGPSSGELSRILINDVIYDIAGQIVYGQASGAIATFTDGGDNKPLKSLKVAINPVQSGSGDPSPENVRPISGWDEVKVVVSPTTDAEDGTTYTIQLDGTYYGGELDVKSGVLRVDRTYYKGSWTQYASSNGYKAWRKTILNPKGSNLLCNPISNMISNYGSFSSANMDRNIIQLNSSEGASVTSYMALQEDVNANEVELCYELETPITLTLTPTQINSLLGNNNIWSDTGEIVECVYQRDLNIVINNLLQQ